MCAVLGTAMSRTGEERSWVGPRSRVVHVAISVRAESRRRESRGTSTGGYEFLRGPCQSARAIAVNPVEERRLAVMTAKLAVAAGRLLAGPGRTRPDPPGRLVCARCKGNRPIPFHGKNAPRKACPHVRAGARE